MLSKLRRLLFGAQKEVQESIDWSLGDLSALSNDQLLASCAVLLEVASVDGDFAEVELKQLVELLAAKFGLSNDRLSELLSEADMQLQTSDDIGQFTELIQVQLSREQKCALMVILWQVIFADGRLETREERFARQINLRLKLSNSDFQLAREEAMRVTSAKLQESSQLNSDEDE